MCYDDGSVKVDVMILSFDKPKKLLPTDAQEKAIPVGINETEPSEDSWLSPKAEGVN